MTPHHLTELLARRSCSQFLEEGIKDQDLDLILQAATTANDHGRMQPWEFRVYQGPARQLLCDAFVRHATAHGEDDRLVSKAGAAPLRAPTVVCVSTRRRDGKVPLRDQTFSAAAACQLMTVAAHLLGHAATWKTGAWATSGIVKAALGIAADEEIIGFIYLGRPASPAHTSRDIPRDRIIHHA